MPKISVNIVSYQEGRHLTACVESILRQTWDDFEIIVVDDGSTDNTPDVLRALEARDSRVHALHRAHAGIAAARNAALAASHGDYIALQDASDLSVPHRLERQAACLDAHPELSVVSSQMRWFSVDPSSACQILRYPTDPLEIDRWFRLRRMGVPHAPSMVRRGTFEAVGGYDATTPRAVDFHLYLRLHARFKMATLPDPLYLYRRSRTDTFRGFRLLRQCHRYAIMCTLPGHAAMGWFAEYCQQYERPLARHVAHFVFDSARFLKNKARVRKLFSHGPIPPCNT